MTMTACSTGMYSIILGCMLLETNQADYVIAGSVDQSVSFDSIKQMCKLRALSTKYNDTPNIASRPWDTKRDGLVMSEGGALFLLAKEKTNNTLCEIAGYSMNNDAYQVVAPHPEGTQIAKCMESSSVQLWDTKNASFAAFNIELSVLKYQFVCLFFH